MTSDERSRLTVGLKALSLTLDGRQIDTLLDYLALLMKWNRAYNLTAVREPLAMVSRHLLDSLSVLPYLDGERFLDVGTGAGLPGLPLAIARPEARFELLDSNGKKTRFLNQAVASLGLRNCRVHRSRVEHSALEPVFDAVTSRAFASLADMTRLCGPLLKPGGVLLAMKGTYPAQELSRLPKPYMVKGSHALAVPGLDGERHLLVIGCE